MERSLATEAVVVSFVLMTATLLAAESPSSLVTTQEVQRLPGIFGGGPLLEETNYTTVLRQLDVPVGTSHIQVLDLPMQYRQGASEDRVNQPFISNEQKKRFEADYPVLKQCTSIYRVWRSDDRTNIVFLAYGDLGNSVLISTNAGKTMSDQLYLGVHRLPKAWYAPLRDSQLPMVSGGKLQIEVTIWKRDEAQRGSPLMGYRYLWKKWDKYLSISIADLCKDTDGDGLTDLFEERILTDPNSRDTDGDGLPDSSDNQPLTPFPQHMTLSDEVVLSLIAKGTVIEVAQLGFSIRDSERDMRTSADHVVPILTADGVKHYTTPRTQPIAVHRTSLTVSAGDIFPHSVGENRLIVLNRDAFERYKRKFPEESQCYAHSVKLECNPSKTRGGLTIGGFGGWTRLSLSKSNGSWVAGSSEQMLSD